MERKREWIETTYKPRRNEQISKRPATRDGHAALLWGSIAVIVGYAMTLLGVLTGTLLTAFGLLAFLGGAVAWIIGFSLRVSYNRRADVPLPFTGGEKIALIGAILFGIGMVLSLATGGDMLVIQLIGVGGLVVALAGVVWHLLTPRR